MKKMFRIVCVMISVLTQAAWAEEVLDDGVAITFVPIVSRAEERVAVELVQSVRYKDRYKRLERAVFENDWRPLFSEETNPGKCTVTVLPDSYMVDCWLTHDGKEPDTLHMKIANDPYRVVGAMIQFSAKMVAGR